MKSNSIEKILLLSSPSSPSIYPSFFFSHVFVFKMDIDCNSKVFVKTENM